MAKAGPAPAFQPEFEVRLTRDLDGHLHLFECESGLPVDLERAITFIAPAEALKGDWEPNS
jgi:hypothetical protein